MPADDIKTPQQIQKKYELGNTAMHDLVQECECSKHYQAIIRITGRTYWVHENLWVKFLEAKAENYHENKFGRAVR